MSTVFVGVLLLSLSPAAFLCVC